uniref:Uncharacterized protein n=1 Tax=Staphylococcus aureus TaxID=1280 RepID=Q93I86_STAAU|nr:hypothetical protein [Staphylococcus aureus]BAC53838.1 hypothetical protein [Staphylococcus aureus]
MFTSISYVNWCFISPEKSVWITECNVATYILFSLIGVLLGMCRLCPLSLFMIYASYFFHCHMCKFTIEQLVSRIFH